MRSSFALALAWSVAACGASSNPPTSAPMQAAPMASVGPVDAASDAGAVPDEKALSLAAQADAMQLAVLGASNGNTQDSTPRPGTSFKHPPGASTSAPPPSAAPPPKPPSADVQVGGVTSTSPVLNADQTVIRLRARIKHCYQRGLELDPTMGGKLLLAIKVGPNGEVAGADVIGNTGMSPAVAACAVQAAKQTKFEAPGAAGATVNVPLVFVRGS